MRYLNFRGHRIGDWNLYCQNCGLSYGYLLRHTGFDTKNTPKCKRRTPCEIRRILFRHPIGAVRRAA